eukprot:TRINITY_DN3501_c0_g1_i9.p1 TRINITY_DN3501_c0_g1~~TRINITY_DN3501_c0_g1_i9.p1  ORF type:complete len:130 (-),score=10.16 TRINITY_DN3501_c0_g1_i9:379-768(-)
MGTYFRSVSFPCRGIVKKSTHPTCRQDFLLPASRVQTANLSPVFLTLTTQPTISSPSSKLAPITARTFYDEIQGFMSTPSYTPEPVKNWSRLSLTRLSHPSFDQIQDGTRCSHVLVKFSRGLFFKETTH